MKKSVSNTLTRWHRVAQRIKEAADKAQSQITSAVTLPESVDFDTFEVRRAVVEAAAAKVKQETVPLHEALIDALFAVRRRLAHANVEHGVSDLLSEIEQTKVQMVAATEIINEATPAMQPQEFVDLGRKRAAQPQAAASTDVLGRIRGAARPRVTFMGNTELAELVAKRDALQIKQNGLADRLADANATRISIEIDERVAAAIGL